ncbi:pentatricopeptide repeat-containing protein [Hordeum vulgare]|nr:pentatricopeptide repeat-containing protein [Hordeum vulgare]
MPRRDVVSWTSLLTGLARSRSHDSALQVYRDMVAAGVGPDEFAVAAALSSCAGATALELGRSVHAAAVRLALDPFLSVGNSLVSMYAKTGSLGEAKRSSTRRGSTVRPHHVDGADRRVRAQNGRGRESLEIYADMVRSGCRPDYVTFIGLLFACSHAGLVDAGRAHFRSMQAEHGIAPGADHYACMVDLLGRAGRLDEAMDLLNRSTTRLDATVWKALLAACRTHRNAELAEHAAAMVWRLDPTDAVPYVMLSNLYSRAGRWGDVARVPDVDEGERDHQGARLQLGGGQRRDAPVLRGGPPAPAGGRGLRKVEEMTERIRGQGYVADTAWALQDEGPEGGRRAWRITARGSPWRSAARRAGRRAHPRVQEPPGVRGLHAAIKMVAQAYGREIVLRDSNCFHHMKDGACSCGDYW